MKNRNTAEPTLRGQLRNFLVQTASQNQPSESILAHPLNFVNGNEFSERNSAILLRTAKLKDFTSHLWATFEQFNSIGRLVKKGERATIIHKWNPDPSPGFPNYSPHHLYNIAQTELDNAYQGDVTEPTAMVVEMTKANPNSLLTAYSEDLMLASGANIVYDGSPTVYGTFDRNTIHLPRNFMPNTAKACYEVLGELIKLQRLPDFLKPFRKKSLSEAQILELLAALGTAFLLIGYGEGSDAIAQNMRRIWSLTTLAEPETFMTIVVEAHRCCNELTEKLVAFEKAN